MPNVKEGSVIEFSYRVQSVFFFNLRDWTFQQTIPVLWSEYTTIIPEYFHYKKLAQGYERFLVSEEKPMNVNLGAGISSSSGTEYHWVLKDVPAIRREPYMTSINNYVSKIEFELGSFTVPGQVYETYNNSWGKVCSNLMTSERFGTQLSRTGFVKETIAPLISNAKEPEKQMAAIYEYVKDNITYNNREHLYAENNLRKVLDTKAGSSAEINLLLIAMLKEAGLEANPVILSTRENGYVGSTSFPNISKFDYVIGHVKIGEKEYLLDATEPLALPNILPVKCLNGQGLLVNTQEARWVSLVPGAKASHTYQSFLTIGSDNSLKGKIETTSDGYTALRYRK
ncbi:MAG: transglutaminase, partial [Cytophagales bacterium CG18_big_fil_WC_8_21_14_2_50_42_9]